MPEQKHGYGACRSAVLSAFLKVDNRHSFFIFMRDAIVQLCCCAFYKAFLTDPIGSSQELTLRATIAIVGSVSSRHLLCHVHFISLKRERESTWDVWFHIIPCSVNDLCACYAWSSGSIWDIFCKLLEEAVTTYQEHLGSYLKKMLQRIRNVLQVTYRRCYNVAGTSWKLLTEDVTT